MYDKHRDAKNWEYIYKENYNIDILFMGSSLIFTSLDPNVIDQIIKYDSFNLGSSSQNIIQTYYNLIEVLKYREIKLIVLDVNTIITDDTKLGFIYNNASGMYFSKNKINSFLNTVNENSVSDIVDISELHTAKEWGNISSIIIKEAFNWKNDIKSINKIFNVNENIINTKGFLGKTKFISLEDYDKAKNKKIVKKNISIKNQKYFDDFIDLCKNNNIELILLQTPVLEKITIDQLDYYIEKHDIPFYDFNFENDIDYSSYHYEDFYDEVHLSYKGAKKFSLIFADSLNYFLKNNI
tara:strand:+ start:42 stop:929 length:888 start_codon:yes stop_codon:yes gene_type:complete